jgi:hypothetical protein
VGDLREPLAGGVDRGGVTSTTSTHGDDYSRSLLLSTLMTLEKRLLDTVDVLIVTLVASRVALPSREARFVSIPKELCILK